MTKAIRAALAFAVISAVVATGSSAVAGGVHAKHHGTTPRWVKHVRRYPGGISAGVRAYLAPGVRAAQLRYGGAARTARPGASPAVGPLANLQINTDSSPPVPQNETAVAYSLDNPMTAVAASNDYVDGGLWIGTTHDGGHTWTSTFLTPRVHVTGDYCSGGDPSVVFSLRDHAFYASQLCFMRAHPESEVEVIRSTDGGDNWTPARFSSNGVSNVHADGSVNTAVFFDKEQLAVDNSIASPHFGRLYLTYIKFHLKPSGFSNFCPAQLAYTDLVDANHDGDLTDTSWTHIHVQPNAPKAKGVGTSANQGVQVAVDDQGGADITFMSEDCNTSIDRGIYFKRLAPDGTLGALVRMDKPGQWADNPDPSDLLPGKLARIPASTSANVVFNPVSHALEYAVQNNINRTVSGADISYAESLDYGQTWSDMRTVSTDAFGNPAPHDQFFPWIAVDPQGITHIVWLDNRNDPTNVNIETFEQQTLDTSVFLSNVDISTASWNPNAGFFSSGAFIGDYIGVAAAGNGIEYPVWTDGRKSLGPPLGQTDIYTVPNN
jgi:hypothetical protein